MRPPQAQFEDGHRVRFKRAVRVPGTNIALLSRPTKLPGPSWSLPAGPACPLRRNGANTICGSCCADNVGRYSQVQIKRAQWARFAWARECLRSAEGTENSYEPWSKQSTPPVTGTCGRTTLEISSRRPYTRAWIRVCMALSWVRFWFPTRSWQAPWVDVVKELAALPNVAVRPSAIHFDDEPPQNRGSGPGHDGKGVRLHVPGSAPEQRVRRLQAMLDREVVAGQLPRPLRPRGERRYAEGGLKTYR